MLIRTEELSRIGGQTAMVDGGFDPIHDGHVEYFRAASELNAPVLCNVSGDEYVSRKHAPLLREEQRARVIDAIRYIDYVHISRTTTAAVLRELVPRMYVKGADWEGRLPTEEVELCRELDIEIVFLDTVRDSSSRILDDYVARVGR